MGPWAGGLSGVNRGEDRQGGSRGLPFHLSQEETYIDIYIYIYIYIQYTHRRASSAEPTYPLHPGT